jgi:hypothetical protein
MMKGLSPIEMMIDKACGHDPNEIPEKSLIDKRSDAIVRVCEHAVVWHKSISTRQREDAKSRLHEAVKELIGLGW